MYVPYLIEPQPCLTQFHPIVSVFSSYFLSLCKLIKSLLARDKILNFSILPVCPILSHETLNTTKRAPISTTFYPLNRMVKFPRLCRAVSRLQSHTKVYSFTFISPPLRRVSQNDLWRFIINNLVVCRSISRSVDSLYFVRGLFITLQN